MSALERLRALDVPPNTDPRPYLSQIDKIIIPAILELDEALSALAALIKATDGSARTVNIKAVLQKAAELVDEEAVLFVVED